MRIIGGHDYYDCGLAYGQDETVVFVRNEETKLKPSDLKLPLIGCLPTILEEGEKRLYKSIDWGYFYRGIHYYFEVVHVVFCGHYFSGVRVSSTGDTFDDTSGEVFWDHDSLDKYLRKKFKLHLIDDKDEAKRHLYNQSRETKPFARYKLAGPALDVVIENRIVVATFYTKNNDYLDFAVNNDTLKEYQFYKIRDAWTAFQEISMFLGGVLPGQGNPMESIADEKVRIHKAGFDNRTSFRHQFKAKPNRKERKKMEQEAK